MFQLLADKINNAIRKIKGHKTITAQNINPTLKEIRRALIGADVHYNIAKAFVQRIKEKAIGTQIKISATPGQVFTKIVHDELVTLMGGNQAKINTSGNPSIILLVGLQGVGKTTLAGKLAFHFKNQSKEVLLTSCDLHRPAAMDQLETLSKQIETDIYLNKNAKNVIEIADGALSYARKHHKKILIIDTAGRQVVEQKLMEEISQLKNHINPNETLLVIDSMMGQTAVETARTFHEMVAIDGIVLTKMDGDTRGGAALAVREVTGKPIKLLSTGEKMADLDPFHPDRMAKRILGMGDVLSLVERAERVLDETEMKDLAKKVHRQGIDFNDLLLQIEQLQKMGSIQSLLSAIPGFNKATDNSGKIFKDFKVMIQSMTPQERANPNLITRTVQIRLAKGSGLGTPTITQLFKKFKDFQQMTKKGAHKKYLSQLIKKNSPPKKNT